MTRRAFALIGFVSVMGAAFLVGLAVGAGGIEWAPEAPR